jgi:hypothetical protein
VASTNGRGISVGIRPAGAASRHHHACGTFRCALYLPTVSMPTITNPSAFIDVIAAGSMKVVVPPLGGPYEARTMPLAIRNIQTLTRQMSAARSCALVSSFESSHPDHLANN